MSRKRFPSYVESSEDEFGLSDADGSPVFSRLKRPRRSHTKESSPPSASPDRSSYQPEENQNSSVMIPDSLDQDDKSVVESDADSVPHSPRDPRNDDTRETDEQSDQIDGSEVSDEHDRVVDADDSSGDGIKPERSPKKDSVRNDDNTTSSGRRRQARKVFHVASESEQSYDGNDDDDAYNSAEDSPPEDDGDSEFDFSPKKPAKKKVKAPAKRAQPRQKAQTPPARKLATRKLATRKLATKPGLPASKKASSKVATTAIGATKSLGARLPHRGLLPAKSPNADKKPLQSIGKLPSAPIIRSGLSRKAAIPRLHAYLPR